MPSSPVPSPVTPVEPECNCTSPSIQNYIRWPRFPPTTCTTATPERWACTVQLYRVTISLVQNLLLTSEQKFRFGLTCPALARPKQNFCFEVNRRFWTSVIVTLYVLLECVHGSVDFDIGVPPSCPLSKPLTSMPNSFQPRQCRGDTKNRWDTL